MFSAATVDVSGLLRRTELQLEVVAGTAGVDRKVEIPRVQRPGLALAGFTQPVQPDRIQVIGYSEITYIRTLDELTLRRRAEALCAVGPACLVITRGLEIPDPIHGAGNKYHVPVLRTALLTSVFTTRVSQFLSGAMSAWTHVHGVMVDVFGVGIVLLGKSGVGKSEVALDLVLRGHRFVADDVVEIRLHPPDTVFGSAAELIRHHMEIRGLGILDIKELFGAASVRETKKIELIVELVEWDPEESYDRVGVEDLRYPILGVEVPLLRIPVHPGRNLTTLIEVAARNYLLKLGGVDSAQRFEMRLNHAIRQTGGLPAVSAADHLDEVE